METIVVMGIQLQKDLKLGSVRSEFNPRNNCVTLIEIFI